VLFFEQIRQSRNVGNIVINNISSLWGEEKNSNANNINYVPGGG
jgi:hypothetical protein